MDIENIFTYHPPFGDQVKRYGDIRLAGKALAEAIVASCPDTGERTEALYRLREAVMWANASIACNEKPQE